MILAAVGVFPGFPQRRRQLFDPQPGAQCLPRPRDQFAAGNHVKAVRFGYKDVTNVELDLTPDVAPRGGENRSDALRRR